MVIHNPRCIFQRVMRIRNYLFRWNDGEPIPESLQPILFAPFKREKNRPSKNGLGLGLYIADQIAKAHGATLSFTSDEKETRFTFMMESKVKK